MSVLPSSLVLPPPSLQRDMASLIDQIAPAPTTAAQQQDNNTSPPAPTSTQQPPATTPQQAATPTEQTREQPKETQKETSKEKEKEKEPTATKALQEEKQPATTTAQAQEAAPTAPPSAPFPSSGDSSITSVQGLQQDVSSPSSIIAGVVSGGSVLVAPSSVANTGPLTVSSAVRPSKAMDLPGLVTNASDSPIPTSSPSNINDDSSSSSNQLGQQSDTAAGAAHKPGPAAVFGLVALGCVGIMACLFLARKISAWRAKREGGSGVLLGVYPAGRDEKGGGGAWKNLGSPMERASSWFGVEGGATGGEKTANSMRYGKSRDSIWSLAQGNRAGLGTATVGAANAGASAGAGHYQMRAGSPTSVLPAVPSRAAGMSHSSSMASSNSKSPLANTAYVLTYSDPAPATDAYTAQRPTMAGVSASSSYVSKHTGGGSSQGVSSKGRSQAPPPTPLASSSICSSIVEMVETGGPLNTSNYPSTEDLLSPSASSMASNPYKKQQHQLHYTSRNPSISSSAGGGALGIPKGSGGRPTSDASNYSSAAEDGGWGMGAAAGGGGGEARGRLYDAVMSQGGRI